MNESIFQSEKRVHGNTHCGACGSKVLAGDMGWMTIRHPSGQINQFSNLCEACCTRIADFFELLQSPSIKDK